MERFDLALLRAENHLQNSSVQPLAPSDWPIHRWGSLPHGVADMMRTTSMQRDPAALKQKPQWLRWSPLPSKLAKGSDSFRNFP